jgi:hypothetical protein
VAADFYQMDKSKSQAGELLNLLARINSDFAQLKTVRSAMVEETDSDGSQDIHYALLVTLYGYPDTATARASFAELDSFIGSSAPALEQCCARHKQ